MISMKKLAEHTSSFRNKLLLPVALMLLSACYLHLVWFPGIYSDVLHNSQRSETDYLQMIGQRIIPLLEQGDTQKARSILSNVLQQRSAWMSIEIDGFIDTDIALQRNDIPTNTALTFISVPVQLHDDQSLTLMAGIDFSSIQFNNLLQLRAFELILVISIVLTALGGYYIHEIRIRKPLLALSRSAEQFMKSGIAGIQPEHSVNELGKLSQVLNFLHSELLRCELVIDMRHKVLEIIRRSQTNFIRDVEPEDIFYSLLSSLLEITDSAYGYIGEVLYTKVGKRYLKIISAVNIGLYEETYDALQLGAVITSPYTLSGKVMNHAELVIKNAANIEMEATGLDECLPLPDTYLGIPLMRGQKVIGMFCLANRKSDYDPELIESLQPIISTCTHLVEATKNERERQRVASELEDKAEYIKAIVDTVVDGIITINERGIIESFNPAAEDIFGYAASETIGQNVSMLMPEPHRGAHDGYLRHYKHTGERKVIGISRELEGQRKDGSVFPMDLAVSEMYAGGNRMFTGIVRDITDRKIAERVKNEFVSVVSHELRTPLTSIHGSLRLIEGGMAGKISRNCTELVKLANKNVERLIRLINDLLDIEKMEAGKNSYRFEKTGMKEVIEYAIQECTGYTEEYNVEFVLNDIPDDFMVHIDHDRIVQVLVNLLSNAAKVSPAGSKVEISLDSNQERVRVSVTDNGPGIPLDFQQNVFKKFCQSDSSDSRKHGGTGLGLSICKAIIEGHGGIIGFDSVLDAGTTFYFELAKADQRKAIAQGDTRQKTDRFRVLICDDDGDAAESCEFLLRNAGFDIDLANDVTTARHLLASCHYDAMILDLPEQDSTSFVRELEPPEANTPLILISTSATTGCDALESAQSRIVKYLDKPVIQQRLVETVLLCIQQHHSQTHRILHIEDDEDIISLVGALLDDTWEVIPARTVAEARRLLAEYKYDLVLLDIGLPDGSGIDLLPEIKSLDYPIVLLSEEDSIEIALFRFDAKLVKSYTSSAELLKTLLDLTEAA
jgi:PAS domain S-box-containing protein